MRLNFLSLMMLAASLLVPSFAQATGSLSTAFGIPSLVQAKLSRVAAASRVAKPAYSPLSFAKYSDRGAGSPYSLLSYGTFNSFSMFSSYRSFTYAPAFIGRPYGGFGFSGLGYGGFGSSGAYRGASNFGGGFASRSFRSPSFGFGGFGFSRGAGWGFGGRSRFRSTGYFGSSAGVRSFQPYLASGFSNSFATRYRSRSFTPISNPVSAILGGRLGTETYQYSQTYTSQGIEYSVDLTAVVSARFAGRSASPCKVSHR